MFKEFKTLINFLNNQRKKQQCINDIVDIFEKTLNSNVSIKSRHEHAKLNWTDYYNNDCIVHINDKEEVEWFSKQMKKQRRQEKT